MSISKKNLKFYKTMINDIIITLNQVTQELSKCSIDDFELIAKRTNKFVNTLQRCCIIIDNVVALEEKTYKKQSIIKETNPFKLTQKHAEIIIEIVKHWGLLKETPSSEIEHFIKGLDE